jgi:hypothetical protein
MKAILNLIAALAVAATFSLAAPKARADVMIAGILGRNLCVTVYNNHLQTNHCNAGDAQNWFTGAYGQQHYHNLCLGVEGGDNARAGAQLIVTTCNSSQHNQKWSLWNTGAYHNEQGYCMDISGGNPNEGAKVEIWNCNGQAHQAWSNGTFTSAAAVLPPSVVSKLQLGMVVTPQGKVIAAGGGNVIAAGGGNVIAAGGGNVVSAGGGNVVVMKGGAVVGPAAGS